MVLRSDKSGVTPGLVKEQMTEAWSSELGPVLQSTAYAQLLSFVRRERAEGAVYPPEDRVFAALAAVGPDNVRVVVLGQDPYHGDGQANGLAFSVARGVPKPPSLRNIHKEYEADWDKPAPSHGDLQAWADQGVLLLNTVLTVRAKSAASHAKKGWEKLTDAIVDAVLKRQRRVVFLLWGAHAQRVAARVGPPHVAICTAHPSPLSAHRGFLGSRPFTRANELLVDAGVEPVDWTLQA